MAKYQVLTHLNHALTKYPPGSEIDLEPSSKAAKRLVELKVIKKAPDFVPSAKSKPLEKFNSASSPAELQKAANKAALNPDPKGFCNKCKANREITNAQIFKDEETGAISTIGDCIVCGGKINVIKGRPRTRAQTRYDKARKKKEKNQ